MKKIIEVKNLYKLYKLGDSAVRALNGVSLEIYEGEFCAIVGTSGSGKSTMLNMLAGLEKPTKGEVIIDGQHIGDPIESTLLLANLLPHIDLGLNMNNMILLILNNLLDSTIFPSRISA